MQTASNDTMDGSRSGASAGLPPGSALRVAGASVLLALTALVAVRLLGTALLSAWASVSAPGPAAVDELLTLVLAALAAGLAAWFLGGVALELTAHVPGRCGRAAHRLSRRITPALARRTAGLVLGVGVGVVGAPTQAVAVGAAATAATAAAQPGGERAPDPGFRAAPSPAAPAATGPTLVPVVEPAPPAAPGFTPTPPRVRPQADPTLLAGHLAAPRDEDEVVVHRGDSLWSIAARRLGPGASDAEVDHAWRRWFALNRDVVGPDPHLLLPGQVLRVPGPDHPSTVER
ncbi:LysM peptidoglycan-binding domain-containing protein [Knoellia sp. CPCC 206435]|uniref:LysM peptidoglycan-binding domain-containing protein n=1 Tax=Knoellia terrae TaxID=3404797 RepID=UPI003B436325